TGVPTAQPEKVGMSSDRLERLSSVMQGYIDDNLLAGTVTLVARKGKVVHFEAQGFRDIEANDPMGKDSIFVMMSMTKPIVSVALMMLYEEGHFLLDDPITNWIPELGGKKVLNGVESRVSAERPVTIRHVLTHTSGLDPNRDQLSDDERAYLRREATVEKTLLKRATLPLNFQPGERWQYGSSTDYVALLVERISGESMDDYLRERIFEPLGMLDTHYNVPESKVDRVAAVYRPSEADKTIELAYAPSYREPTTYFPGTYGLSSTAADYFKFQQMVLNGGELNGVRLLSPKTVNLMITNHTGDRSIYIRGPGYGFGLGYSVLRDPGLAKEPLTPGSFSWGGAWGTIFWVDPAEEMIGIMLTQITSYRHLTVRQKLAVMATQAIIESYSSESPPVMGYEKR
ncbi:MAG: serine hydrolase domain-containing protein, partial [Candidatus Hydrogenedentota bacterium]